MINPKPYNNNISYIYIYIIFFFDAFETHVGLP